MRRLALAFLFIFLISSIVFAQEECGNNELQFQFKPNETISFAYLVNNSTHAWRFSTDLKMNFRDGTSESKTIYTTDAYSSDGDSDGNSQAISMYAQILFDHPLSSKVKFYYGVGPILSYNRSYSLQETKTIRFNETSSYENRSNGFEIGLIGTAGISCEVSEPLSFIIEYSANAGYQRTKHNSSSETRGQGYNSKNSSEEINKNWMFSLGGIKLGVAVKL